MSIINFKTDVKTQTTTTDFEPLPEDRYTLRVEKAEKSPTKAGGEKITTTFIVESGELTKAKFKGRKIWHNFNIGGKSNIYLYNFLKAINSPLIDNDNISIETIMIEMQGKVVTALAEPGKTPTGKDTSNLSKFVGVTDAKPASGTGANPASDKNALFA